MAIDHTLKGTEITVEKVVFMVLRLVALIIIIILHIHIVHTDDTSSF